MAAAEPRAGGARETVRYVWKVELGAFWRREATGDGGQGPPRCEASLEGSKGLTGAVLLLTVSSVVAAAFRQLLSTQWPDQPGGSRGSRMGPGRPVPDRLGWIAGT